ncbi:unnamed protein product [Adineta ricciae]|uniref:SHSP domain-containing protein n=1 Tax=Adineta ricciae TaxID=249248 RepID=A0A814YBV7_ADIRI|nr:unnamed protein product [Adineta ricciae]CAF1375012.1 unnamed protein product [Adineta ricciae]
MSSPKTDLTDDTDEKKPSTTTSNNNSALSTILAGLRLYENNTSSHGQSSKYCTIESLYDVIIRINNISDLRSKGWEVLVNKHTKKVKVAKSSFDHAANDDASSESKKGVVATVIGAYNRGKTFLLEKLCGIELPTGNLVSTEGISITAGRENYTNIVFLDTAGTDTPVSSDEIEFKRATEALLREVVLHLSTFLIIVVNRLRATDQIYIKEILKYLRNYPQKKSVVIIHNFLDVETVEDLEKVIEDDLGKIFKAKADSRQVVSNRVSKTIKFFTSKQNGIDVSHYILAKARSDASKNWNRQTFDGVMNLLQNSDNKRSLNLVHDMIEFINTKLPQLLKQENHSSADSEHNSLKLAQHCSQPYIVLENREYRGDLSTDPVPLELSEKLVYDDAGYFIRNESGQWQPRYNLYEDKDQYCLIIEASGFKKGEIKTSIESNCMKLEGTRSDLIKAMTDPVIRQSDIPIGSFKLEIPFKDEIEPKQTQVEREDGFIRFTLFKKTKDEMEFEV